jgi:hypothetical protein
VVINSRYPFPILLHTNGQVQFPNHERFYPVNAVFNDFYVKEFSNTAAVVATYHQ